MDFARSEEQNQIRTLVRNYMNDESVRVWMEKARASKEYPHAFMKDAAQYGFLGMNIGQEHGGMGMSYVDALIAFEEFAYASIPFSLAILVQNSLAAFAIQEFGSPEQQTEYLPLLASGTFLGCFANSEPIAGSDAKNIQMRADLTDDGWILNGEKHFCSSASEADIAIVFARTSTRQAGHPGTTAFLVRLNTHESNGITITKQTKNAIHGSTLCAITFDNARANSVLDEVEKGWNVCERVFLHSRLWIAMQGVGAARCALDETLYYVTHQRHTFGKPIIDHQHVAFELAKCDVMIHAARLLTLEAAEQEMTNPSHRNFPAMASRAKYLGTQAAQEAALCYYRFCGGMSITQDWPAAQHLLDSLVLPIYEGPNEIQLQIIANYLKHNIRR